MRRRSVLLLAAATVAAVGTGCSSPPRVDRRDATRPTAPFYVDPTSQAARNEAARNRTAPNRTAPNRTAGTPADTGVSRIASEPMAVTLNGESTDTAVLARAVAGARTAQRTLVLQVYDLPRRDVSGGFSAGGARDAAEYRRFTAAVATAIQGVPTVVVLEPDSLGQISDLPPADQQVRYDLLNAAVDAYAGVGGVAVYLDGTHSGWLEASEMANRLQRAGVDRAQGFAVNVANFQSTDAEGHRGEQISDLTGGAHYVVDTSRNGAQAPAGSAGGNDAGNPSSWCNPGGQRLGVTPTTRTAFARADAYLWIKRPGESDGACGPGQPNAGQWFPSAAAELLGRSQ